VTPIRQELSAERRAPASGPGFFAPDGRLRTSQSAGLLIASASLPKDGERVSGDRIMIRHYAEGSMIAVVDVLGHGPKASGVADLAAAYLHELDSLPRAGPSSVLEGLHGALRGTRGAAAMVCVIKGDGIEGCGVGNVELRSVGVSMPVVLTPGILGAKVRQYRAFAGRLSAGAVVFVFSDGISRHSPFQKLSRFGVEKACRALIDEHRHSHDDASAVVLAYEPEI
jgi:phosphoserine phosphatase RsbX